MRRAQCLDAEQTVNQSNAGSVTKQPLNKKNFQSGPVYNAQVVIHQCGPLRAPVKHCVAGSSTQTRGQPPAL